MQISKSDQRMLTASAGIGGGLWGALGYSTCLLTFAIAERIHNISLSTINTPLVRAYSVGDYRLVLSADSCLPEMALGSLTGSALSALVCLAYIGGRALTFQIVRYIRDVNRA